jgi:hypothetical protein
VKERIYGLAAIFSSIPHPLRSPFAYRSPLSVGETGTPRGKAVAPERSLMWERLVLIDSRGFKLEIELIVPIRS